ncbi:hypothetical protein A3H89_01810 [Candidatus Amesbacteria bacterium RIFCSPLOWO2_02_FULL_48_11]|uniref:SIMPL domain-containing protein n=2 Tax=Candidatus Amesiibacteriota TaxID=1752730 RepID=A0A1F4Z5B9_9BACT|nr:MAG: hypothetical protein UX78_C0014G0007 [Candidatus Amesbacteria bacterium GW2011_GWA2_47_11]OGD01318.1 MAG: hypothetical protein A3E17_03005 [Candidatus Amesbacteria bacterium RIFCSPHIGHO2_12_FULL_48_14]OGD07222.1 MAG: hypothetical protein A3H89_01810 [Candidatus Amesbacteria bacterium RIFCSPLOWO2_02_FULL_48_11]
MNSWWAKIIVIFAAAFIFVKFAPGIPVTSVVTQKQDLFTVSGVGKVTVVPDTGIVDLGINLTRGTVKTAQTEVNRVMNTITDNLKKMGIDGKDIKTENYSVYPEYDYTAGTSRVTGYRVSASLKVTVRELDKLNQVIDTATADGANTVSGIQLTVDDKRREELMQQARNEAVKRAKSKADSLSRAAGISLGRIINIQESGTPGPEPVFLALDKAGRGGGGETQIQPGSTDIVSNITLTYETR